MEKNEQELLYPTLGKYLLLQEYGLWFKNNQLLKNCLFMAKNSHPHEDDASALIIRELWKRLRKTHALRVVK